MYLTMKENVSRKYGIQNLAHTVIQHVQLIYDVLNTIFTSFGVKSGLRDLKWYVVVLNVCGLILLILCSFRFTLAHIHLKV